MKARKPGPLATRTPSLDTKTVARFWSKVAIGHESECWLWTGAKKDTGYGAFRVGNATCTASRYAYAAKHGPIDPQMHVLHSCDNPPCCNPEHLKLGTVADNSTDKVKRGRHCHGSKRPLAKLTNEQVMAIAKLWATGALSQKEIATRFGVNQSQVSRLLNRKRWRHVDVGAPKTGHCNRGTRGSIYPMEKQ